MRILLETKKFGIYACTSPLQDEKRRLMLYGVLIDNTTKIESFEYQKWNKDFQTTL